MPTIGGVSIGWDEASPSDTESAGLGDDRIRSTKTSLRQALDAEHNWPSGGGANTGYHVYGSARPYVGLQSAVSSSGSDGRLMYASDSSRLFGVGSEGTVLLGDSQLLSVGTTTGISRPQRAYWACEFGADTTNASGFLVVTYPNSGFSGIPFTYVQRNTAAGATSRGADIVTDKAAASFRVTTYDTSGVAMNAIDFNWLSTGTRTL